MSNIDPIAARLYDIAEQLTVTNRRVVDRDASGAIAGVHDVPTNVPRLVAAGMSVMESVWDHQPASVDAQARYQQLDAIRRFAAVAADHGADRAVMWERFRQASNAIVLYLADFDDPG